MATDVRSDVERLVDTFGQRCYICSDGPTSSFIVMDHDHSTGMIRGLLCRGCNALESRGSMDERFVTYRSNPPAAQLGIRVPYRQYLGHKLQGLVVSDQRRRRSAIRMDSALWDAVRSASLLQGVSTDYIIAEALEEHLAEFST